MKVNKLLLILAIVSFLFTSCKTDEEKRNDKIIAELSNSEAHHRDGAMDYQRIVIYRADSLDYWAVPQVQELITAYMSLHDDYERQNSEARRCSDPSLVLKAASYGLGGDRYANQRRAENAARESFQAMQQMDSVIIDVLNSSTPSTQDGIWAVEEYKYHKYEGSYITYNLYHFSNSGELISPGIKITLPNPFQIINRLIGDKYTSEDIYSDFAQ